MTTKVLGVLIWWIQINSKWVGEFADMNSQIIVIIIVRRENKLANEQNGHDLDWFGKKYRSWEDFRDYEMSGDGRKNREKNKYSYQSYWSFPKIDLHSFITKMEFQSGQYLALKNKAVPPPLLVCTNVLYSCKLSDVRSHRQCLVDDRTVMRNIVRGKEGYWTGRISFSVNH